MNSSNNFLQQNGKAPAIKVKLLDQISSHEEEQRRKYFEALHGAGNEFRLFAYYKNKSNPDEEEGKNEKKAKVFFFDIGLAQRKLGLNLKDWLLTAVDVKALGAIAEQFVAQEYIAYSNNERPYELYYWHRESKSSNAEVDFLFVKQGKIFPVEVKSGVKGGMKSMKAFLETHPNSTRGLKVSQAMATELQAGNIVDVPFYALSAWIS